jgi:NADH dehydrogenase/NADH:ubiquinone oxidoreductase subunit G
MTVNINQRKENRGRSPVKPSWNVAKENDYRIPTLCYHKDLSPTGNCRMCVVEVKGGRFLQAACVTQVWDGMEIETDSQKTITSRKLTLEDACQPLAKLRHL